MKIQLWKLVTFALTLLIIAYAIFPGDKQLSEMYMGNFEYDKAEPLLTRAHGKNERDTRALRNIAKFYGIIGKTKKQMTTYETLVKILPRNEDFRYELAKLYRWNNQPLKELEQLEILGELTPNDPKLLRRLIGFYNWRKESKKAVAIMKKLIDAEPYNPKHYIRLAEDYLRLKKHKQAIEVYEKLIPKMKKRTYEYHLELADLYEWQKMYKKGIDILFETLEIKWGHAVKAPPKWKLPDKLDSEDREIIERLGILYLHLKKYDTILAMYASLIEKEPDNKILREDEANFLNWMGKKEDAINKFLGLLKDFPKEIKYITEIADTYTSMNRLKEAESYYLRALKLDPSHGPTILSLSRVYIYMEKPKKSIPLLLSLLKKNKGDPPTLQVLAEAYFYSGEHRKATAIYEKLVRLFPDKPDYKQKLADAYLYSQQYKKAIPIYEQLVKDFPDKPIYFSRLGESLVESGELEDGIVILRQFLEKRPQDIRASFNIASAYTRLNKKSEAAEFYTLAINNADDFLTGRRDAGAKELAEKGRLLASAEAQKQQEREKIFRARLYKGQALKQLGQHTESINIIEKLYYENPKNEGVLLAYGYGLMQMKQFSMAHHLFYPSSLKPNKPEIYRALASLHDSVDNSYTAAKYYEKVLETYPNDKYALVSLALNYQDQHRPKDALAITRKLAKDHADEGQMRALNDSFSLANSDRFSSHYYYSHLISGELVRYNHNSFEGFMTNKLKFLGDLRFGNYRHGGEKIDAYVATLQLGGKYWWNETFETRAQVVQYFGGPKKAVGLKFTQNINIFDNDAVRSSLTFDSEINNLWLAPVIPIKFKGVTNTYELTYDQLFFQDFIRWRASIGLYDTFLQTNGGHGRERTLETTFSLRLLKNNPKFVTSFRYFRDSPTEDTMQDSHLREAISLDPVKQYQYIFDLNYKLPNGVVLLGSSTWSGKKDQREAKLWEGTASQIGWSTGFIWPLSKKIRFTFNAGNSAAGSEGGIADTDTQVFFGQLDYNFF